MKAPRALHSLLSIAFLLSSAAAWAAQSYTVHLNGANGAAVRYVSPHAVRYVEPTANRDTIFLLDQGTIIRLDHASRSYAEVKVADLQRSIASQWSEIDPQKRAQMQRMGIGAPSVTPLGPGETIVGYSTERYLLNNGVMRIEVYAAPQLEVPRGYYDVVGIGTHYSVPSSGGGGDSPLNAIKGCILRQVMVGTGRDGASGRQTAIDTVTAVEVGPIPASEFTVPPGYQKKEYEIRR